MTFLLAIGTKKGLFLASSPDRAAWEVSGPIQLADDPYTVMSGVYSIGIDKRHDPPKIFVGADSSHFGPSVWTSDDLGRSWHEPAEAAPISFPADTEATLTRVWQFAFEGDRDVVYAGAEPHSLWRSDDGGRTFALNRGLWDHPHHADWFPGFGGGAVHTILPHPTDAERMSVAMSTGGVYRTVDGGQHWSPTNHGIRADFLPDTLPEYGQCVHKATRSAGDADRMYAQNHGGVYRSDDEGASWESIAAGLPADFGFSIVAHPHLTDTVLAFPIQADANRFLPDDRLQVYRSDDAGRTWHSVSEGLPRDPYYAIVLRDAATTDSAGVAGFYFGTRCGDVFAATDESPRWSQVASHLPDVLCVRALEV